MIWTEHKDYQLGQILYDVGHCLCVLQIKMGPQWETFVAVDFLNIIFTSRMDCLPPTFTHIHIITLPTTA